jgi:hypothetical protein
VPPWQLVSALLGGVSLRVATWWPPGAGIPGTTASTPISCWQSALGAPGAVDIATTGTWGGTVIGLTGEARPNGNHAKLAVSTSGSNLVIFGDMNQDGSLSGTCDAHQNGRGGLFFVLDNQQLFDGVTRLLSGASAPLAP